MPKSRADVRVDLDWEKSYRCMVQVDGHDLVRLEFDDDGNVEVRVWKSPHSDCAGIAADVTATWDWETHRHADGSDTKECE